MRESRYLEKDGTLRDKKVVRDIRKAAEWYENGEIVEAQELLQEIVYAISLFEQ